MTELIYCADGNRKFAEIAIEYGFTYGAQLPNTVYFRPEFADQNWRKPDRQRYMAALAEHRPRLATVLDLERDEQFDEVLSWADEAAQYATEAVIIIPKAFGVINRLPREMRGRQVRLGFSVPTRFAGTQVPTWEFSGWPIHLLGGSPNEQMKLSQYLNVASADGNYAQKMASAYNQFFAPGTAKYAKNRYWPQLKEASLGLIENDGPYHSFRLSCINIRAAWSGNRATIRYATEMDIPAIKHIANQYKAELGFVMTSALKERMRKFEVYVAMMGQQVVGFVHWHKRRDGWRTIYEIAVDRQWRGKGIGKALLGSLPAPLRLKCTQDNPAANDFYKAQGMTLEGTEPGRKRALNIWNKETSGHEGRPEVKHRKDLTNDER